MKNFFKKNILIILFLALPLFSGCKKQDKVILKFSSWGSKSELAVLKPLISEYEKLNPSVEIELLHIPKNYFQKLHLLVASNLTPDVVFINNIKGRRYIQHGVFENLNDYFVNDEEISKSEFFEKSLKGFENKEGLYAVPRDISNLVVYYNKKLFDKYKVPYPNKNWDFDQFLITAKKLTKDVDGDGKIDIFGSSFEENSLFWLPFLWSNGGGIISDDLSLSLINTKESKDSLVFYSGLRHRWHVSPRADEQGSATMAQLFLQEKIAMHISGRWSVPGYRKNAKFDWDVIKFPQGNKGSIVDADASGWAISKASKNKNEAWKFVKFLASQRSISDFTSIGLIIPSRHDVADSNVFLDIKKKPVNAKVFIEVIPESMPTPANEKYQEIIDIINKELEPVFRGKKTVYDVVDEELNNKIQKLLN